MLENIIISVLQMYSRALPDNDQSVRPIPSSFDNFCFLWPQTSIAHNVPAVKIFGLKVKVDKPL